MREGAALFADSTSSEQIGAVTSGGFGPTLNVPWRWAMCHAFCDVCMKVFAEVRGRRLPLNIVRTPFCRQHLQALRNS